MHGTDSDPSGSDRHDTSAFSWRGPYGHVVRLIERLAPVEDGIVLDIGFGGGQLAAPLTERGIPYVGCQFTPATVASLVAHQHEAHKMDASLPQVDLIGAFEQIIGERPVLAITLTDFIDHVDDPAAMLATVREIVERVGNPPVIVSVPNVAHYDVAAKLLSGRWDVTATGLLGDSRVTQFTERRMLDLFADLGWGETDRDDVTRSESDQAFPEELPVLSWNTPVAQFLRQVRDTADDVGTVSHFVRAFEPTRLAIATAHEDEEGPRPFLSVGVRTQGRRPKLLIETLTSLAAQTDQDFEVLLMVNARQAELADGVQDVVALFDGSFAERVRVILVEEAGRVAPLNTALDLARGHYLAFLDDDDVAFGHWVEEFHRLLTLRPGSVARCLTMQQGVDRVDDETPGSYRTCSYDVNWSKEFNLAEHLANNQSPFCSFAVPVDAVRALGIRFSTDLQVVEDWEFLLRCAIQLGVVGSPEYTTSYRWWSSGNSLNTIPPEVWDTCRRVILDRLDRRPLLLPPGSASALADLWNRSQAVLPDTSMGHRVAELEAAVADQAERLRQYQQIIEEYERSTSWKVTRPLRAATERIRERRGRSDVPDDAA